jgi:rSAM/selenodomain-associated transferase 2
VSVIIPTLNEAEQLPLTLKHAAVAQTCSLLYRRIPSGQPHESSDAREFTNACGLEIHDIAGLETCATGSDSSSNIEIIIADGGSHDATLAIARSHGAKMVTCASNRAHQMNAGAAIAESETLLFLHADTHLPENWHGAVLSALRQPDVVGGAFRFRVRDPFPGRRLIEHSTNLRSRLWRMPYGDQVLFVRRWAFDELGGFPDLPIMEDYEFVRRLRRLGRLALLDAAVLTSGRRWQRLGVLRTTLINKLVILGYHCGVSPARLAAFYRGQRGAGFQPAGSGGILPPEPRGKDAPSTGRQDICPTSR